MTGYRQKFTFFSPSGTKNPFGEKETEWAAQFTELVKLRVLRGGETVQASRLEGRQVVVASVPASSNAASIEADWMMTDARSGQDYEIAAPPVLTEDRRWYEVTARTGVTV